MCSCRNNFHLIIQKVRTAAPHPKLAQLAYCCAKLIFIRQITFKIIFLSRFTLMYVSKYCISSVLRGARGGTVVEALLGSIPDGVIGIFH
jgi:hypothetical protein